MKTATQVATEIQKETTVDKSFAIDTTFVLFFLAIEFGLALGVGIFENFFLAITLLAVAVLPYFTYAGEKPSFGNWLFGRSLILGFALLIGIAFKQSLGVVLPTEFRFLPMTLLIVSAMVSCYIQFYGFFKLRLAK